MKKLFQTAKSAIEKSPIVSVLLMIGVLCLVSFWWMSALPVAASVQGVASPNEFSAERSFAYLTKIASQPHPLGTAAHDYVRSYLMDELSALGLDPQIQHTTLLVERGMGFVAADLDNILFRIKGTNSSKAILLVAHYDSVISSPGAGDDGAGVAALIETGRVLHEGPSLRNDVVFLLSDGEEQGSLGAKAFLREHPWAKTVGAVLNFEARGTAGPSLMFETGTNSDWLVKDFIKTVPYPYANSLMPSIYKLLPNDTDLTDFKKAGLPGLNFAFAERGTDYHSPLDSLARISMNSLEHHGTYALSMVRYLGQMDLNHPLGRQEEVYFNILGKHVVTYSLTTAWILTVIVMAGCIYVLIGLYRRKIVTPGNILLAIIVIAASVVVTGLTDYGVVTLLHSTSRNLRAVFDSRLYPFVLTAISLAVGSAYILWPFRGSKFANMQVAALVIWTILVPLSMLYCPGASYVVLWPMVAAFIVAASDLRSKTGHSLAKRYWLLLVMAVPVCILLVSTIQLMYVAFFADAAFIPAGLIALFLAIVLPQWKPMLDRRWWVLPSGFAAIAIVLFVLIAVPKKYSPDQPRADSVLYLADTDKHEAIWVSPDPVRDSWTSQFFSPSSHVMRLSDFPVWYFGHGSMLSEPTAMSDAASASVDVVKDIKDQDGRTVSLLLRPEGTVPMVALKIESKAKITGVNLDDIQGQASVMPANRTKITQYPDNEFRLRYFGLPANGALLTLHTGSMEPLAVSLISESYNLPLLPGKKINPRADDIIPRPGVGDKTIICRSYVF